MCEDLMVADALTKGLPTPAFLKHKVEMLGMGAKVHILHVHAQS
jgi:hypothetical protein